MPVDTMLHVAVAGDGDFLKWSASLVRSLLQHNPVEALTLHLVHDTSAATTVRSLGEMIDQAGAQHAEHEVSDDRVSALVAPDRFGPGVWYRLLLSELLNDVDRVLYLDADTMTTGPLEELWETDLQGASLGAARNVVEADQRLRLRRLGLDPDDLFNSGVLLLDLAQIRASSATDDVLRIASDLGSQFHWADQEALNLAFVGRWHPLHPKWNAQTSLWQDPEGASRTYGAAEAAHARDHPVVVHFEGPASSKPWNFLCRHPLAADWRSAFESTPFRSSFPQDRTAATRLIAMMPSHSQSKVYMRLIAWRSSDVGSLRYVLAKLDQRARDRIRTLSGGLRRRDSASMPSLDAPFEPDVLAIVEQSVPHTMASPERLVANMDAVDYVVRRGIPGAIVECGVWRGGSVLAMIRVLQELGVSDREIWLYDTFEGMTEPGEHDVSRFDPPATDTWRRAADERQQPWAHWFSPASFGVDAVRTLISDSGYPETLVKFVVGPVESTIPAQLPAAIAVLRLDTDWYESTRHEMEYLYPRLSPGGVLIIDDYGHWDGARRAVDEYLAAVGEELLLQRTDYTARMAIKPG